jgi:hypothetical protein
MLKPCDRCLYRKRAPASDTPSLSARRGRMGRRMCRPGLSALLVGCAIIGTTDGALRGTDKLKAWINWGGQVTPEKFAAPGPAVQYRGVNVGGWLVRFLTSLVPLIM